VESRWLPDLRIGRPVSLVVTGMEHDTVMGHIARINPVADPATRQVRVYVEVANPGNRLVGGLYVSGFAVTREVKDVVAVPRSAIRSEGTPLENVVYVVASGRIARRVVRPGVEDAHSGLVQVDGINAGESVVVGPVDGLAEGTRVETSTPARN
jgi:multidrug efflux pump subunit AcrA (membrane-fusion protein)